MRKKIFGRKLKRDINQRKALFRSLMGSLVIMGKIKTTEAKARAIKGEIEKLVTRAKKNGESARRILVSRLANEKVVDRIISDIAPKFIARKGGYTRILRLGPRVKDAAPMVIMSWVEEVAPISTEKPKRYKVGAKNKKAKQATKEESSKKTSEPRTKKSSREAGSRSAGKK